jgi:hypothetical protein
VHFSAIFACRGVPQICQALRFRGGTPIPRPRKKVTPAPLVHRRTSQAANRIVKNGLTVQAAAEALGPIVHGCEIYSLVSGQFSLIDVIGHVLGCTGPADLVLSTWTAAGADLEIAYGLMTDGRIRRVRFIVDFSFPSRQPAYCGALRERFGDAAIIVTKNHAKFVLVTNDDWKVVVRTSMNLNLNRRLENIEISEDPGLAAFLLDVVDRLFLSEAPGESLGRKPYANCVEFGRKYPLAGPETGPSTDETKYFGDGPFDTDIRRAGISWG